MTDCPIILEEDYNHTISISFLIILYYIIILFYTDIMRTEISTRSDFTDVIKRNKAKSQNRGNDDVRYRRLRRELARS